MRRVISLGLILWGVVACSRQQVSTEVKKTEVKPVMTFDFLSSRPMHELIVGWPEMLEDIEAHAAHPKQLEGKKYSLQLRLQGRWNLEVIPQLAVKVQSKGGGHYIAEIIDSKLLFEEVGSLVKMAFIGARLSRVGGQSGNISVTGNLECLYPFTFYQRNGEIINFEKLQSSYELDFVISNPNALKLQSLTRYSAVFKRPAGGEADVSVKIKLRHRSSGEIYEGEELLVPKCSPYMGQIPTARFLPVKPGQCIHHLKTEGMAYSSGRNKRVKTSEWFFNTCDKGLRCVLPARYAYLHGGKIAYVEDYEYDFRVKAKQSVEVDTSWNYNSYVGSYSETLYNASKVPRSILEQASSMDKNGPKTGQKTLTCGWLD